MQPVSDHSLIPHYTEQKSEPKVNNDSQICEVLPPNQDKTDPIRSQLTDGFLSKLEASKNDKIIATLVKFPKKADYSSSFVREHSDKLEVIEFLKINNYEFVEALSNLPEDENIEDILEDVINISLETGLFKNNLITLINGFAKIPKNERSDLIDLAWKTSILHCQGVSHVTASDFIVQVEYLYGLSGEERENYVDILQHSFLIDSSMNPEVTKGVRQIPMGERSVLEGFPGLESMRKIAGDLNPVFLFYLIPELSKGTLFDSIHEKLGSYMDLPEETQNALLSLLIDHQEIFSMSKKYLRALKTNQKMLNGNISPFEIVRMIDSGKDSNNEEVQKKIVQGKQLIRRTMSQADKVKIMWCLERLDEQLIPFLAKVPEDMRANSACIMTKLEFDLLKEEENIALNVVQKLSVFSQKNQFKFFNILQDWVLKDDLLAKALAEFPQDQMVQVLNFILSFPLQRDWIAPIVEQLIRVPHQERLEILELAKEIVIAKGIKDLGGILEQVCNLLEIPESEDRLDYVDACKSAFVFESRQLKKLDHDIVLRGFLNVPKNARKAIPCYLDLEGLAHELNPIFTCYLLQLSKVKDFSKLKRQDLDNLLQKPCFEIIQNLHLYPEATVKEALDTLEKLGVETQYSAYVKSILEGIQNPYKIDRKLRKLLKVPLNYKPAASVSVNDKKFSYDMKKLKRISEATEIKREDLPKEATLEAFMEIFQSLMYLYKKNPQELYEKIGELLPPEDSIRERKINAGYIICSSIDVAITKDGQKYLTKLLQEKGPVADIEAKWRMLVNHMVNKKNDLKKGQFFTDRQEAFLRIMSGIIHCKEGKEQGIHAAYSFLEPEERGKVRVASDIKSIQEIAEDEGRKQALKFLKEFGVLSVFRLVEYAKSNTKESAGMFMQLLPYSEKFYDTKDDIVFTLNSAGAKEVIAEFKKEEAKEEVLSFVSRSIQIFMEKYITGVSDEVMKELTKTDVVSEPSHQKKYLRNLIGSLVGLKEEICFDAHTGILNTRLLGLSRKEVLDIFFKHASIKKLAEALTNDIHEGKMLALFQDYLPKREFWKGSGDKISSKGVLELLLQTALC